MGFTRLSFPCRARPGEAWLGCGAAGRRWGGGAAAAPRGRARNGELELLREERPGPCPGPDPGPAPIPGSSGGPGAPETVSGRAGTGCACRGCPGRGTGSTQKHAARTRRRVFQGAGEAAENTAQAVSPAGMRGSAPPPPPRVRGRDSPRSHPSSRGRGLLPEHHNGTRGDAYEGFLLPCSEPQRCRWGVRRPRGCC